MNVTWSQLFVVPMPCVWTCLEATSVYFVTQAIQVMELTVSVSSIMMLYSCLCKTWYDSTLSPSCDVKTSMNVWKKHTSVMTMLTAMMSLEVLSVLVHWAIIAVMESATAQVYSIWLVCSVFALIVLSSQVWYQLFRCEWVCIRWTWLWFQCWMYELWRRLWMCMQKRIYWKWDCLYQ